MILKPLSHKHLMTTFVCKNHYQKKVWLSTLQKQMAEHWDGRFPVKISESLDMFLLTFGCVGDKIRVLDREPYHFQNHHIVLYSPEIGTNFTSEDLKFTPFWVQVYRLPFLSKTKTLAIALGNIIGDYKDVYEDSLNEGWGPFLRIRVLLDVSKPLKRGRMISLSHVKDKFWVIFAMRGYPNIPFIKGSTLPTSNYDRYRTDFAKGDAWPLITRLAKRSLTSAIPQLNLREQPHPRILYAGESSNINNNEVPSINVENTTAASIMVPKSMNSPITFKPSSLNPPTMLNSISLGKSSNKLPNTFVSAESTTNFSDLSSIYMPATGHHPLNTFATYPPSTHSIDVLNKESLVTSATKTLKAEAATVTSNIAVSNLEKENFNPNVQSKRQNESLSLRQTLKRCRGTTTTDFTSTLSVEKNDHLHVSNNFMDSDDEIDNSTETVLHHNKKGGNLRNESQMDEFRSVLDTCNLNEFPFKGDPFTWTKGRHRVDTIKERLDRCFTNDLWNSSFQPLQTSHLDFFSSDHREIAVNVLTLNSSQDAPARRTRFRFEKMWLKEEEAAAIIRTNWSSDNPGDVGVFLHNLSSYNKKGYDSSDLLYYANLFALDGVRQDSLQDVLNAIPSTITSSMNQALLEPFTSAEVVTQRYLVSIMMGMICPLLNKSIITLIPKVSNPSGMSDYRPISLCNVIYKLISKAIVLRFQKVLPFVISETQSAFLSNRLITDNILVAFELIHHLRHKTPRKCGFWLKLDMSKAFDRVEWQFLEAVMLKMGFHSQWVTLIMNCITTSSFSFSLNGEVVGHVQPHRGLRQETLSLYLFLICSKGFSRLFAI
uniref:Reverse transcriptase domain-containing protein n=1 Tax=Cannabis sativa TaxID=3483 RepID=A0A803PRI8_CANSA